MWNGDVCDRAVGAPPARPAAPCPRTPALAPRASANHNTLLSLMWLSSGLIFYHYKCYFYIRIINLMFFHSLTDNVKPNLNRCVYKHDILRTSSSKVSTVEVFFGIPLKG